MAYVMGRARSVRAAVRGFAVLGQESNSRIHLVATVFVVLFAALHGALRWQWCVLLFAIGAVWTAEALNTALEKLADACSPEPHPLVAAAKDVAATGVLVAALAATLVFAVVFWP